MNKKANIVSGFLYWLMALIIVALFLPVMIPSLALPDSVKTGVNGAIINFIITYFPIALCLMLLIILIILART